MTAAAERVLAAMTWWSRRGDRAALEALLAGLSETERLEARAAADDEGLMRTLYGEPDADLAARMVGLASKTRRPATLAEWARSGLPAGQVQHKILEGEAKSVAVQAPADTGTFSGYLATIGNRDLQGDTIEPGALDQTVADFKAGRLQWFLTDSHSEKGSDVVAQVTDAALDGHGLKVWGSWMPIDRAQQLREMVRGGARLGLSIDYVPARSRPDGKGGRRLVEVMVLGGAITPKPANPMAFITGGKSGGCAQAPVRVVTVAQDIAMGAARHDPDRERLRRMAKVVEAAGFPPPHLTAVIGVENAYDMTMRVAAAKAAREVAGDPERARERERMDRANAHSYGMAEAMARLQAHGCRVCWSCQAGGQCVHV
jgi:HK97 family phage prohead protease